MTDGISDRVQVAKEALETARAAEAQTRENMKALEDMIEAAKSGPPMPDPDIDLEEWL